MPPSSSSRGRPSVRARARRRVPRLAQPDLPLTHSGAPVIERQQASGDRRNPAGKGYPVTIVVRRHGREFTHTISEIARGTSSSISTISLVFAGRRPAMASTLYRIATYLKVSQDDLYAFLASRRGPRG